MENLRWLEPVPSTVDNWIATPYYDDPDDQTTMYAVRIRKCLNADTIIMVWKDGTINIGVNGYVVMSTQELLEFNQVIQEAFKRMNPINNNPEKVIG